MSPNIDDKRPEDQGRMQQESSSHKGDKRKGYLTFPRKRDGHMCKKTKQILDVFAEKMSQTLL